VLETMPFEVLVGMQIILTATRRFLIPHWRPHVFPEATNRISSSRLTLLPKTSCGLPKVLASVDDSLALMEEG
jgi:hypothetical protein